MDKAISLDSSEEVLIHDDCSFDPNTLVSLLDDAFKSNLKDETKIKVIYRYLPGRENLPPEALEEDGEGNLKMNILEAMDLYAVSEEKVYSLAELKEIYESDERDYYSKTKRTPEYISKDF